MKNRQMGRLNSADGSSPDSGAKVRLFFISSKFFGGTIQGNLQNRRPTYWVTTSCNFLICILMEMAGEGG